MFESINGSSTSDVEVMAVPRHLEIDRRDDGAGVVLAVRGELDLASAPLLERRLQDAERQASGRVVLDFAALEFIDSTGIHLLLDAQQRAQLNGHRLVLRDVPARALRLFSLAGIDSRFAIEHS